MGRQPTDKPSFTLADVRRAVPAHCFKRSLPLSLMHLGQDVAAITVLALAALYIFRAPVLLQLALWPAYWFLQVSGWK